MRAATRIKRFCKRLKSVGSEAAWRTLPSSKFADKFVDVAFGFSEKHLTKVIQQLDEQTYSCWIKKLWTEQDIEPCEDNYNDAYDESVPTMIVLKRSLLLRLVSEQEPQKRMSLQQQLAHISLILAGPEALGGIINAQEDNLEEEDIEEDLVEDVEDIEEGREDIKGDREDIEEDEITPEEIMQFRAWKRLRSRQQE